MPQTDHDYMEPTVLIILKSSSQVTHTTHSTKIIIYCQHSLASLLVKDCGSAKFTPIECVKYF